MTMTSEFSVATRELLRKSLSLNQVIVSKYLIVFHLKRVCVFLKKIGIIHLQILYKMFRSLIISVLAIPIVFHVGYADVRSDQRLGEENDIQSSRKDTRHGKNLILDNER